MGVSGRRTTAAEGHFDIPANWPKWKKKCGAKRKNSPGTCTQWAVIGMPTCKYHGSGGAHNKELGELRYLAWIVVGAQGPQDMPIKLAVRFSLAMWAEYVLNSGKVSVQQRMKAALFIANHLT